MRLLLLVTACALAFAVAQPAGAIVPPRDCGTTTVKGKRYQIKADQLRCRTAKPRARRYLRSGDKPSGYRCKDFGRETKMKFRCSHGVQVFFAIRR